MRCSPYSGVDAVFQSITHIKSFLMLNAKYASADDLVAIYVPPTLPPEGLPDEVLVTGRALRGRGSGGSPAG
jgi:hypothetical protein